MTKIKLCGLTRPEDIAEANELNPEYIGFVFAAKSKREVSPEKAVKLKAQLSPEIQAVGVFVNETPETVAGLLDAGIIDIAQLHGQEDETYIQHLRKLTNKPLIQVFCVTDAESLNKAEKSLADLILLDSGSGGTGTAFDWTLLEKFERPYFLAGGLDPDTVGNAVKRFRPYAVDVSSGIETAGKKDKQKMAAFVAAVRKNEK